MEDVPNISRQTEEALWNVLGVTRSDLYQGLVGFSKKPADDAIAPSIRDQQTEQFPLDSMPRSETIQLGGGSILNSEPAPQQPPLSPYAQPPVASSPWYPTIAGGGSDPYTVTVTGGFLSLDGTLGNLMSISGLGSPINWSGSAQYFVLSTTGIDYQGTPSNPLGGASCQFINGDAVGYSTGAPWSGPGANVYGDPVPSAASQFYQTSAIYPLFEITSGTGGVPIVTMFAFSNLQWEFTGYGSSPAAYPKPF